MSVKVEEIDRGWIRILRELRKLNNSYTAVGFFGHGGTPGDDIAARAAVQELGATIKVTTKMRFYFLYKFGFMLKKSILRIPKRPFMSEAYDDHKNKINKQLDRAYDNVLYGRHKAKQALSRIGEAWVGFIKLSIRTGNWKKNSSFTIKQKGSSRPLIKDGEMFNAVQHKEFMK
ncbi:MAG: hypothetical protein PVI88_00215 [Nitrosopumilaceae archaeon]|jgi:hypothetical protein